MCSQLKGDHSECECVSKTNVISFRFDANGNGMISKKEMKKLIQDIYHLLDDGKPDKGNKNKKALTENAMREMDADNDGRISEEEFVKAVLNQQKVAKLLTLKVVQVFDPDTTQSKLTSWNHYQYLVHRKKGNKLAQSLSN